MCTACGICEKNCKKGAIRVQDTFCIDDKLCNIICTLGNDKITALFVMLD